MADTKITDLAALTGANSNTLDVFPLVDVSDTTMAASGTTKKMTRAELAVAVTAAHLAAPPVGTFTNLSITDGTTEVAALSTSGVATLTTASISALAVSGPTTLTGAATLSSTLGVTGGVATLTTASIANLSSSIATLTTAAVANLAVSGPATLSGTVGATGGVVTLTTASVTNLSATIATLTTAIVTDLAVSGATTLTGALVSSLVTDATSSTTGAMKTAGGLGVAKAAYVGTDAVVVRGLSVFGATLSTAQVAAIATATPVTLTTADIASLSTAQLATLNTTLTAVNSIHSALRTYGFIA